MNSGLVSYLAVWGPYAIAILSILYSIMLKLRKTDDNAANQHSNTEPQTSPTGLALIAGLMVAGFVLTGIYARPSETSWKFAAVLLVGGLSALAAQLVARLKADSPYSTSSATYLGLGLALLEMAVLRNHFQDAPMTYLFVTALGAWFATSVLYYGRLSSDTLAARTFALASTIIAAAVAMGAYRYTKTGAGSLFPIDACAIVILASLVCSITATWGRFSVIKQAATAALFLTGTWWLTSLMANLLLDRSEPGLCVLTGAATVLALYVLSANSGAKPALIGDWEAGVLAVLLAIGCAALSMRWLGGYGVSLAATGALSVLGFVHILMAQVGRTEPGLEIAGGGVGVVAALGGLALVRVYAEGTVGVGASMHLFESYVTTGLVLGGALAVMQAAIGGSGSRRAFAGVGKGFGAVLAGIAIVLAAAYFWRGEAIAGMMLGTAMGLFLLIAARPFFGRPAGSPELALGLPLFTAVLAPAFLAATINLTRDQKVLVMVWTLAVVGFLVMVTSVIRLRNAR